MWSKVLPAIAALLSAALARGEEPKAPLKDELLDKLIGHWTVSRKIRGTVVSNTLDADWAVQHQYVLLHMKDVARPPQYEAPVLVGFDAQKGEYVAHWRDSWGAQYSSVGRGKRAGDAIDFAFPYPDGPFHNTFTWDPASRGWQFLMEAETQDGFFAEDTVRRE
jgi:hypothetical protein